MRINIVTGLLAISCGVDVPDHGGLSGGGASDGEAADSRGDDSTSADASSANADDTGDGPDDSTGAGSAGVIYDVGGDTEAVVDCECGSQLGFSYIWIANSAQNTVSKVNTMTLVEEGRYPTRPDGGGNPSRTSVSIDGLAVAVANRYGGVTKIWAREQECDAMRNGVPGVQTSSGKDDVRAWDDDDCIAWHAPFDYLSQRPIAWSAGAFDPSTCEYEEQVVWTAGCSNDVHENVLVHRLDGETGAVLDTIDVAGYPCLGFGSYGGVVDGEGNFWISSLDHARLGRIEADTHVADVWQAPHSPYGISVDDTGRPWMTCSFGACTAMRFDPLAEVFDVVVDARVLTGQSGIAPDGEGRMWLNYWNDGGAASTGLVSVDVETLILGPTLPLPSEAKGVSVDLDGRVWSVSGGPAYRVDPETGTYDSVTGFQGPYSYSDMTGWALQNAQCEPAG